MSSHDQDGSSLRDLPPPESGPSLPVRSPFFSSNQNPSLSSIALPRINILRLLSWIARSDGQVSKGEHDYIFNHLNEILNVNQMCANYLKAEVENLLSLPSDSQEIEKLVSEINDERDRKLLLMSSYMIVCLSCDSLKDSPKKEEFRAYSQLKDWLQLPPDIVQKIEQDADRELKSDKFKIDDGQDIEGAPSGWIHELSKVCLEQVTGIIAGAFLTPLVLLIPGTSPPPSPTPPVSSPVVIVCESPTSTATTSTARPSYRLIEGLEAEASFYKTDISVDPNSHSILKSEEYKIDSLMQMLKDNPDIPKIIKITKPVSSDENSIINLFKEYATKNEQNIQIIVEKTNEPIGKIICEVSPPTPNISFKSKAAAYQGFNALRRVSESIETSIAEEEFGTLVAASIKQKLKTSQSTDKETEKAG